MILSRFAISFRNRTRQRRVGCRPQCVVLAVVAASLTAPLLRAQNSLSSHREALAVLDGEPILEEQLPKDLQAQLRRMEQQIYLFRLKALHAVIDPQLLGDEAKQRSISQQELVRTEIAKLPEPTDAEVRAYYEEHKTSINQSLDESKEAIRQNLRTFSIQNAGKVHTQSLFQEAINNGQLTLLIRPPKVEVAADPLRLRGNTKAPVMIVEFSDFGCSFCQKAESTLSTLLARYPGQLKISYRDFPLPELHPDAEIAAEASHCAAEQGKYWQYHDVLFAHLGEQGHDDLIAYAKDLGLDDEGFAVCLSAGRYRPQVQQDIQLALRSGVLSTPSFFVNGTFVHGAQSPEIFEGMIDHELAAAYTEPATDSKTTLPHP